MAGPQLTFVGRTGVLFESRELTFFGGNDYHRLSRHPEVVQALIDGAQQFGLHPSGSRVTTGNHPLYGALEAKLAEFLGAEAATLLPAGYMSNAALLETTAGEFTLLFLDEKAHPSLREAAAQSGKRTVVFRHQDPEALSAQCALHLQSSDRPLLLTDGVTPNTGDLAPLAAYQEILRSWNGEIHIDDCHGMGVLGGTGKGSWEAAGLSREGIYQTGTLSKAFGGFGGVVVGTEPLMQSVRTRSMGFVGSTPMPLPVAAAALRAIEILAASPELVTQLSERVQSFKAFLRSLGFRAAAGGSPILSVTFFNEAHNQTLSQLLLANGIYPSFINYPGCPPGGHFRFTLSMAHTDAQVDALRTAISAAVHANGSPPLTP